MEGSMWRYGWWMMGLAACGTSVKGEDSASNGGTTDTGGLVTDTDTLTNTDTDTVTTPAVCYEGAITVRAGQGATGYEPLADGDVVQMVHGPQGGFHLETALAISNVHQNVQLHSDVTVVASGKMISGIPITETGGTISDLNLAFVNLLSDGECSGTTSGLRAFLDSIETEPSVSDELLTVPLEICGLDGQEVDVHWEVLDLTDSREAEVTARVVLALDPVDRELCDTL